MTTAAWHHELVSADLSELARPRRGHFDLGTGYHGDLWLELDGLFLWPARIRPAAQNLAGHLREYQPAAVCGPVAGGAFLAQMVAEELGGEFLFAEQFSRPGGGLYPVGYRIPDALRPDARGKATAVVDDVINAGSAVRGSLADLHACGARPVALGALLVLGASASACAAGEGVPLEYLACRANTLWEPAACPCCAVGVPLEGVPDGA